MLKGFTKKVLDVEKMNYSKNLSVLKKRNAQKLQQKKLKIPENHKKKIVECQKNLL